MDMIPNDKLSAVDRGGFMTYLSDGTISDDYTFNCLHLGGFLKRELWV